MSKTLLYVVILALLGFGIYYFLFNNRGGNPYGDGEAGFQVKDTGNIGRIFIVNNDGESALVERTDSCWIVNKKYKALPSAVSLVLNTLAQQAPLYPVTQNAYENVVKGMATDGIKVELYDRQGKKMKVFYVGGASVNNTGTNMLMEGAKMPYVVQVPGFVGYVTARYATRLTDWRDRTVFNMPADEIKTISVQYADKPINSFTISRDKDSFTVKADESLMKGLQGQNPHRVRAYFTYFSNVNCEGYLNGLNDMDTTIKTAPKQSSIDILGIHGQHQHAEIYWMALNKRSKNALTSNPDVPDDYDSDRLYAIINGGKDTVMIQQFAFRNIFHKAYEFFQNSTAPTQQPKQQKNVLVHKHQ